MIYPFMPFLPDMNALSPDAAMEALNVIPTATGYRPMAGFASVASAITARAQGAVSVRDLSGTIHNFCGDATKLYKMASDGLSWSDVSRLAGGAYAAPAAGWWVFFQFGNTVLATNGVDAWQSYTLGTSTNFALATGSIPVATFGMTVRDFGVTMRTSTAWNRVTWSGINDITAWTASATTLSDSQDLPDGGAIMGGIGGEYGIIGQEKAITRMSFEGPPTAFRFDKITQLMGVRAEGSMAAYEGLLFFLSDDGLKMIRGGVEIIDIGAEKVDRFLETDIDANNLHRITSAIDPINKLYVMGYASSSGGGTPDSGIAYHWPTGKFSRFEVTHEILYVAATQSGYTLDGLDSISGSIDALTHSLDSRIWTGSGRLLLAAFNSSHQAGFFSGANLAATIETGDAQLIQGRKSILREARPIVQGTSVTPSIAAGRRNTMNEAVTYGSTVAANSNGLCKLRSKGRYHRAKVTIPASSTWEHAIGISDIEAHAMGGR
jgi:hypothetical protein